MEIVFVLEKRRDFVLVAGWNEPPRWKCFFKILNDVVALDVYRAIMHQHRNQPARIDTEKPRTEVLVGRQVDEMRFPLDTFEVEEDAELLRARGPHVMKDVDALPIEDLVGVNVAFYKLNHISFRSVANI